MLFLSAYLSSVTLIGAFSVFNKSDIDVRTRRLGEDQETRVRNWQKTRRLGFLNINNEEINKAVARYQAEQALKTSGAAEE